MVDSSHDAGARTRWIGLTSRILVPCSALQIRARLRLVLSVFAVVVSSRGSWAAFTCVMRHLWLEISCFARPHPSVTPEVHTSSGGLGESDFSAFHGGCPVVVGGGEVRGPGALPLPRVRHTPVCAYGLRKSRMTRRRGPCIYIRKFIYTFISV